jgi:O-antigen ligase
MAGVFSRERALSINAWAMLIALVLLVATPVRSTVVVALLMLYGIAYLVANRHSFQMMALDWWVVLLISALLIGRIGPFVVGGYSSRYLSDGLHMVATIPIYLTLRHAVGQGDVLRFRAFLEWGLILGAIGGGLLAIYQTQWLGMQRADGFLFSINFGYLNATLMTLALVLMAGSPRRWWLALAALAAAAAVLLSGTRGAWLVIPVALLLVGLAYAPRLRWKWLVAGAVALPLLAVVVVTQVPEVERRYQQTVSEVQRIQSGNLNTSVGYRFQFWYAAMEAFKQRPLIGLSYPEREALNAELQEQGEVAPFVGQSRRGHAHSQYFEMMATGGLIGLLALLGYLVVPGIYHARTWWLDRENVYALAGLGLTVSVLVCGLTEVLLQQEMIAAMYAYLQGMLLVLALAWRRHPEQKPV